MEMPPAFAKAHEQNRTADLLLTMELLYRLSYVGSGIGGQVYRLSYNGTFEIILTKNHAVNCSVILQRVFPGWYKLLIILSLRTAY